MTFAKLAQEIARREGKKSQARIGDIREILNILVEMEAEHFFEMDTDLLPLEFLLICAHIRAAQLASKKAKLS